MKVSISWIFDHINSDWKKNDIKKLIEQFNQKTAEIENFHHLSIDLSDLEAATIKSIDNQKVTLLAANLKKEISINLNKFSPCHNTSNHQNCFFLINLKTNDFATFKDLSAERDGYLPAFDATDKEIIKNWKKEIETEDIILEVDNKSITHRPDMWGHRGFAREIAAFLDLEFIHDENKLLEKHKIEQFDDHAHSTISIENKATKACNRLSGLHIKQIENKPSNLFLASRLLKVGTKPINSIIDLTNYVMLDWSQPMHAFDSSKILGKKIIIRMAKNGETLKLLDENKLTLTSEDLVIANSEKAMALAGVMGGEYASICKETNSIFLESAHFEAATIRKTAVRHKIRTDSSARFEKTLDPNQITAATLRFLKLAKQINLKYEATDPVIVVGKPLEKKIISLSHQYLEDKSGFSISKELVIKNLEKIGFKIEIKNDLYQIEVPSFRAAKDIKEKEDILEEVVRFYGFEKITPTQPIFFRNKYDLTPLLKLRKIKNYLSSSANMIEQQNYAMFDEEFLSQIKFNPSEKVKTVEVLNPVSENNKRLVTTLIPHLLKNIKENILIENKLYFFEFGRTWKIDNQNAPIEQKKLAGIFFHKKEPVDFYEFKYQLSKMFEILGLTVSWQKSSQNIFALNPNITAEIHYENKVIGFAGMADKMVLANLETIPQSEAFIFEIDGDFLLTTQSKEIKYSPLSKFQESSFDLSFIVPVTISAGEIEKSLKEIDPLVTDVKLIDFFEKSDWLDKKALAFRILLNSSEKTLEKEEIEAVRQKAIKLMEQKGLNLR
ncbi:TPA: phenylalanine--tRNA ligase subunit beta [Candidatus Dependentiae bacterium]|nr:MAG: Phenylalanine-tRNA ligase beta subunit [candidate division TM6 bacterium GW2011_GWE2_31_21]KKP53712.1 MAG: Phenylalanine-tRNA ligase beta subunit [candidate division TM6 bacterium GW2011_GWF2_33_332]HBS48536.1 phenylalanine--tRNA ligase subunit beta [Candidatus Dependentiae bacterium]HBZ73151.1 phenylalanine--tRNA ligase subunit beta [Candidatus Dependentiae bacterium]